MTRRHVAAALFACCSVVLASSRALRADVRADEKTKVEFAGMLGRMVNLFGGKAAREGVTSTVAVKGDRKATMNEATGQIIDLSEEKIYDLDLRKKTYRVTTFAELRRQMEEAQKKAQQEAEREPSAPPKQEATTEKPKEYEIDFTVKNTGETKQINGYDTHQAIATVTVREKGKTLEQSGGLVMTTDLWLAPKIAQMKEITDFDVKYAQKLYGPMFTGVSAQQMAAAMAMYPGMKEAMLKMNTEASKLEGTPILTTFTMEGVKSQEQMAQEAKQQQDSDAESKRPASVGGLLGGLAKKAAAKRMSGGDDANKQRAQFMSGTTEVLKVVTDVAAGDVAVPAGFKEGK